MEVVKTWWRNLFRKDPRWAYYREGQILRRALIEVCKEKKSHTWFVNRSYRLLVNKNIHPNTFTPLETLLLGAIFMDLLLKLMLVVIF